MVKGKVSPRSPRPSTNDDDDDDDSPPRQRTSLS
jgi:hypothetical protein